MIKFDQDDVIRFFIVLITLGGAYCVIVCTLFGENHIPLKTSIKEFTPKSIIELENSQMKCNNFIEKTIKSNDETIKMLNNFTQDVKFSDEYKLFINDTKMTEQILNSYQNIYTIIQLYKYNKQHSIWTFDNNNLKKLERQLNIIKTAIKYFKEKIYSHFNDDYENPNKSLTHHLCISINNNLQKIIDELLNEY